MMFVSLLVTSKATEGSFSPQSPAQYFSISGWAPLTALVSVSRRAALMPVLP